MRSFILLSFLLVFLHLCVANGRPYLNQNRSPAAGAIDRLRKKRGGARFTWYNPGLGACGGYNRPDQFVVAISQLEWDNGSHCGKSITISYRGKSTQAVIVDECASCPFQALDLSPALFGFLAPVSAGQIYGDWTYGTAPAAAAPPVQPSTTTSAMPQSPTTMSAMPQSPTTMSAMPQSPTTMSAMPQSPATDGMDVAVAVTVDAGVAAGPLAQLNLFFCEVGVMLLEAGSIAG